MKRNAPKSIEKAEITLFKTLTHKIESPKKAIFVGLMRLLLLSVVTLSMQQALKGIQSIQLGFFGMKHPTLRHDNEQNKSLVNKTLI